MDVEAQALALGALLLGHPDAARQGKVGQKDALGRGRDFRRFARAISMGH